MTDFENYIENSEIVQLAILESVQRYYYDQCFDKVTNRPKDNEETKRVSAIHKELWCKYPDWRARLKTYLNRYNIDPKYAFVKSLEITNKPKREFRQLTLIHFSEIPIIY